MAEAKRLLTRTHKGASAGVPIGTSRTATAEDEVQQALQQVRMAHSQCESVW